MKEFKDWLFDAIVQHEHRTSRPKIAKVKIKESENSFQNQSTPNHLVVIVVCDFCSSHLQFCIFAGSACGCTGCM